jgi:hypothetical protein
MLSIVPYSRWHRARSPTTVRGGKSYMQIEMHDVESQIAGLTIPSKAFILGAIAETVHGLMNEAEYFDDVFINNPRVLVW